MIKSIHIHNFQKHIDTRVDLHPGVNIFRGESNEGKSAIFRSIRWFTKNRPLGWKFKNWDAGENDSTFVEFVLDNATIQRYRSRERNCYKMGDEEFEAIGYNVPPEVQDILNFSEFNLQGQHEINFMLNETPGAVAKKIGSLVGLDIVDEVEKIAKRKNVATKQELTKCEELELELEEEIQTLYYVEFLKKKIIRHRKREETLHKHEKSIEDLTNGIEVWEDLQNKLEQAEKVITLQEDLDEISETIEHYDKVLQDIVNLEKYIGNGESFHRQLEPLDVLISQEPKCIVLREQLGKKEKLDKDTAYLEIKIPVIEQAPKQIKDLDNKIAQLKRDRKNILEREGICPTCGAKKQDFRLELLSTG